MAAQSPAARPRALATAAASRAMVPRPASRVGKRAAHGVSPNTRNDAALAQ